MVLFDGEGKEGQAVVTEVSRKRVVVEVGSIEDHPFGRRLRLTIATAMPRKHRQAFLFEKCTELGVWAIWPTLCERSVALPKRGRDHRWRRTAIEAAKQCGRCWLPRIEAPLTFAETVARASSFDLLIVPDVGTLGVSLLGILSERPAPPTGRPMELLAWIGPEGGWTPGELDAATHAGAVRVSLGKNILRVETAALAVAAVVEQVQ